MRQIMQTQSLAKRLITILSVLTTVIIGSAECAGAGLIGSGFLDGKLYDINPTTGAATNPRNLGIGWALAFSPNGILYGVTQGGGTPTANTLYTVNPVNGMATMIAPITVVGAPMLGFGAEGDIAFDPTSGVLYAVDGIGYLYTVNTSNGVMSLIASVPNAIDLSAMAFDASGNLYIVDSAAGKLLGINKSTAAVISSVNLSGGGPSGAVGGLSFDPCSGVAYLAYGSSSGEKLHTLNIITGVRTVVGPLSGTADGVANLAWSAGSDLYMKDTMTPDLPEDFGAEPTVSQTLFISRDIWLRTAADAVVGSTNPGPDTTLASDSYYANEHQHQNPTYVNATTSSYIYVKVRNRGCTLSAGTEKLRVYWANASTGLPWPGAGVWNEFDCVAGGGVNDPCPLPVIGPGQDYVVELPWVPPNPAMFGGNDHFCLVARIETLPSAPFGMTFDESQNQWLWQNVAGNNNIVWKNLTVFTSSGGKGKVIVRNTLRQETVLTLRFAVPSRELKNHFLLHGDIFVDLGEAVMKKWRRGGQRPRGFVVVGKSTIKVTDPTNAVLDGLLFGPGEEQTIEVRMQLKPGNKTRPGTSFNWDVIQMVPLRKNAKPSVIGGERYNLIVPKAAQGVGNR